MPSAIKVGSVDSESRAPAAIKVGSAGQQSTAQAAMIIGISDDKSEAPKAVYCGSVDGNSKEPTAIQAGGSDVHLVAQAAAKVGSADDKSEAPEAIKVGVVDGKAEAPIASKVASVDEGLGAPVAIKVSSVEDREEVQAAAKVDSTDDTLKAPAKLPARPVRSWADVARGGARPAGVASRVHLKASIAGSRTVANRSRITAAPMAVPVPKAAPVTKGPNADNETALPAIEEPKPESDSSATHIGDKPASERDASVPMCSGKADAESKKGVSEDLRAGSQPDDGGEEPQVDAKAQLAEHCAAASVEDDEPDDESAGGHFEGKVLAMFSHYGWITPLTPIDHPEAYKNGGRIYFSYSDVLSQLQVGEKVSFNVYVDSQGLGADCVRSEGSDPAAKAGLRAEAPEFHPSQFFVFQDDVSSASGSSFIEEDKSWLTRNMLASAKLRADVGDKIRWEVVLEATADIEPAPVLYPSLKMGSMSLRDGSTRASDLSDRVSSASEDESDTSSSNCEPSLLSYGSHNLLVGQSQLRGLLPPPGL